LIDQYGKVEISFRSEDFIRIFLAKDDVKLKIEFINDVGFRVGTPYLHSDGFLIDTWQNILSNKITALARNAAKDYVDILFMALRFPFNWEELINDAKRKDAWVAEHEVAIKLLNFDLLTLKEVMFSSPFNVESIKPEFFKTIARDALHGFDNSLAGTTL